MTLAERLAAMRPLLAQIAEMSGPDLVPVIREYMAHCHEIAVLKTAGLSDDTAAALETFLDETAPQVTKDWSKFDAYGGEAVRLFMNQEFVGNDWAELCVRRSHVEGFNELYTGRVDENHLIYTEELDEDLREKARLELLPLPDGIPKNMPEHHWWWRLE